MKKILIVAPFVSLPGEPYFNRFLYLSYLWAEDYEVTLVTSSFCHQAKQQRNKNNVDLADLPFNLVLLQEPGYRRNVSFARFWSHRVFHDSFKAWFLNKLGNSRSDELPFDLVYSAFPLISTNLTLGKLKETAGYKLVIDVQDIWPDSIFSALPFLKTADFLLSTLRDKAHQAYGYADGLVAVSETYLQVALSRCPPTMPAIVAYLGSDYQLMESIAAKASDRTKIRLVYIGTLSHSYDMKTVVQGFSQLRSHFTTQSSHRSLERSFDDLELHILGDGPDRARLERLSGEGVFFHGYLPYEEMIAFVKSCHLAVNPIVGSATQSITNKLSDYVAFGLPILSSQKNEEAMTLIKTLGGYLFEAGSVESFAAAAAKAVRELGPEGTSQPAVCRQNSRKTITITANRDITDLNKDTESSTHLKDINHTDALFDRRIAYPKITEFLEQL